MSLLWAVPVVAVAVAVALVLARLRSLEDLSVELARSVRRTGELRRPLFAARRELDRSGPLVERIWAHWSPDEPVEDGSQGGTDGAGSSPTGS